MDPVELDADVKKRIEGLLDGSRRPPEPPAAIEPVAQAPSTDDKSIDPATLALLNNVPIGASVAESDLEPGEEPPLDEAQLNELMVTKAVASFRLKQAARDK